jgi:prepilin-type N-terminal cleavage/methylation domain-containing protein
MVCQARVRGFTLLEVLIALLIASVGLLGIAGLVLHSMRASFESKLQTTAALLAVDVHERAWLASHLASTNECQTNWINLNAFSPGLNLSTLGINATVAPPTGLTYPDCELTVSWDAGSAGVVGGMATFGGMYTHRFTIPSVQ